MDDVFEAARNKISTNLIHTFFNSEGSYTKQGEYYILSPLRGDSRVGSFHINEESGAWYDHATDEGGDFIDLVAKARCVNLKEAAEHILNESGGMFINSDTTKKKKLDNKKPYAKPILPIPDTPEMKKSIMSKVREKWWLEHWGRAETISRYFNEKGEWNFCVCRFVKDKETGDKKRSKTDMIFYYGDDGKWWSKWHNDLKPFPLFGVQNLKDSDLPVLIVEGEKCGRVEVPGFNVISWVGGTSNMKKSDWKPLLKKDIFIWPDTDSAMDKNHEFFLPRESQPGMKAAYYIKSILPKAKILEIYKNKPIEDLPGGWDIADHVEDGGDPVKFIEEFTPYKSISVEIDPYHVYRKFIDDFYEFDSMEQINSRYWVYNNHFWKKIPKNDIYSNFQRWLEDTGLQWQISAKKKATTFINETLQYIGRHSLDYVGEDSFLDAAIIPYIHLENGAIKITKDSIDWFPRGKYEESFFKGLYPTNCLDFELDFDNYKNIDPVKDCPTFYYFVSEMIPKTYMSKLNKSEKQKVIDSTINYISQIIAYSLSPIKPNEYFFGMYGGERTGKSFLIKIIKSIIGAKYAVEKQLGDMDNRFASAGLWGKKLFIVPDLKTRQPLPAEFIKSYSGEQELTIEEKNLPPVDGVKISIAMFFISNYEFHVKGVEGVARRFMMLPYKNDLKKHDVRMIDKISGLFPHGKESGKLKGKTFDERPALLSLALNAWNNFSDNDFIMQVPDWVVKEKNIWLVKSNSVVSFIEETYMDQVTKTTIKRADTYDSYKDWCKDEGRKALGKMNYYEEIRRDKRIESSKMGGFDNFIITPTELMKKEDQDQENLNKDFEEDIPF